MERKKTFFRKLVALVELCLLLKAGWLNAGNLETWTRMTNLPGCRYEHACAAVNNFLYVIGGHTGAADADTVYYTRANPDGTLAPWQTTTPLPKPLSYVRTAVYNNTIYVLGGGSEKVYYGKVSEDGTVAKWESTSPFPRPMGSGTAVVCNNTIYYLGGFYFRGVYCATINQDGSLGEWKEARHLPSPRAGTKAFVANGYIYLVGGNAGHLAETQKETVYRSQIKEDGSLGTWSRVMDLPVPNASFAGILVDRQIFVLGGSIGEKTYVAQIDTDGNLGDWTEQAPLPEGFWSFDCAYINGWVYITGGFFRNMDDSLGVSSKVYGAPIE